MAGHEGPVMSGHWPEEPSFEPHERRPHAGQYVDDRQISFLAGRVQDYDRVKQSENDRFALHTTEDSPPPPPAVYQGEPPSKPHLVDNHPAEYHDSHLFDELQEQPTAYWTDPQHPPASPPSLEGLPGQPSHPSVDTDPIYGSGPVHHHHYHAPPKKKGRSSRNVQLNSNGPPQQGGSEQMLMLMMNQIMMQQMAAQQQQMQVAQMVSRGGPGCGGGGGGGGSSACARTKGKTSVNIKNRPQRKRTNSPKVRAISPAPVIRKVAAVQPAGPPASIGLAAEPSAFDDWQEATIILCLAIVGLIYLVSTRSSDGKEEKKPSLAAKHLT